MSQNPSVSGWEKHDYSPFLLRGWHATHFCPLPPTTNTTNRQVIDHALAQTQTQSSLYVCYSYKSVFYFLPDCFVVCFLTSCFRNNRVFRHDSPSFERDIPRYYICRCVQLTFAFSLCSHIVLGDDDVDSSDGEPDLFVPDIPFNKPRANKPRDSGNPTVQSSNMDVGLESEIAGGNKILPNVFVLINI